MKIFLEFSWKIDYNKNCARNMFISPDIWFNKHKLHDYTCNDMYSHVYGKDVHFSNVNFSSKISQIRTISTINTIKNNFTIVFKYFYEKIQLVKSKK